MSDHVRDDLAFVQLQATESTVGDNTAVVRRPASTATPARGTRRRTHGFDRPRWLLLITALVFLYTFIPIAVVVLFSFNGESSLAVYSGFSLQWYKQFFNDSEMVSSLTTSVRIGVISTLVATVLGTLLAFGLQRGSAHVARPGTTTILLRLVSPEITSAIGLFLLTTQLGLTLSLSTIIVGHITFSIAYVTVIVRSRLAGLNPEIEEAAMDLGATRVQAVRLVALPRLWPAIIASGLLAFVLSFDDFITSFFMAGTGIPPLPVRIYAMIKSGVSPVINAIGTLMMAVTIVLTLLALALFALQGAALRRGRLSSEATP